MADTGNRVGLASYVQQPSVIDDVVTELHRIERKTGLERTLAVGRLVLEKFFAGSEEVWRQRRKNKNNSVRRIAAHPDCPLSRSALNDAIAAYVSFQALPCVQTFGHVGACHLAAVNFLSIEQQASWLERAEQSGWSVRQLKDQLRSARQLLGERRGRPRSAPPKRLISSVRTTLSALKRAVEALHDVDFGPRERSELAGLADETAFLEAELRLCERPYQAENRELLPGIKKATCLEELPSSTVVSVGNDPVVVDSPRSA